MHKKIGILMLLMVTILLPACSAGASNSTAAGTDTTAAATAEAIQVPLETQLSLGTMQLEGTEYVVNAEQAAALLPLWKLMKVLGESDITAQVEVDAVLKEIQASMSAEQLQAIEEMTLAPASMPATTRDAGNASTSQGAAAMGGMPSGGMPGGDMPAGGGGGAPDMAAGGAMLQMGASTTTDSGAASSSATLYDTVIAYLEAKVNA
jgi:hypothetical protein